MRHEMARPDKFRTGVACTLLAAGTLLVYLSTLHNGFVAIDDHDYILDNTHVTAGLTWPGIWWALRSSYASNWHPLTWISHMLDCQLFGLNPAGHHLVNVLLHTANSVLVFLLFQRMTEASGAVPWWRRFSRGIRSTLSRWRGLQNAKMCSAPFSAC